jgi:hypothetical protein
MDNKTNEVSQNRVQFCHDREWYYSYLSTFLLVDPKGGRTIAVEVPTVEEFFALNPSLKMPVPVKIGIAVCSKKDLYNKKIGRELAVSRMKDVNFYVTTEFPPTAPGEPRILELYNSELDLTIQFTKHETSKRVYFEGVV